MNEIKRFFQEKMIQEKLTWKYIRTALTRKKIISHEETELARVLTTVDLTALGIGSTLGVGVYVLAGQVAKDAAGPAVVISFLIAAIASVFAGLCYAEFGARVPKAGSAYVYSYVSVGEFIAFLIGWNLILEYVIGSASVVKGLFMYLDALVDNVMSKFFEDHMPMNVDSIASYPDFFSLGVTILFSLALAFGAKESSFVNNIFTVVNLVVVCFAIISGMWKVDASNWNIPADKVPAGAGKGGFAPFGVSGIIKGAASCFYGFIGFDCIATAGEEAKTPQKSIPIAIVISLFVVFVSYFGISTVLTMILPYYEQDSNAPFPHIYDEVDWPWAKYIVSCGALCGLFSSLLGAMFPLPRIIYAMSSDGLIFKFMGKIHPKFQTPFLGTLLAGTFTGILSCIFELKQLYKMMSIGTLLAYSMVAGCILILRYDEMSEKKSDEDRSYSGMEVIKQLYSTKIKNPTKLTSMIATVEVSIYAMLSSNFVVALICFAVAAILSQYEDDLSNGEVWIVTSLVIFFSCLIAILASLSCQPKSTTKLSFAVPLVPWLPGVSMLINIYLMTMLDSKTWIRFGVWLAMGLFIYFVYGIWNSHEQEPPKSEKSAEISNKI